MTDSGRIQAEIFNRKRCEHSNDTDYNTLQNINGKFTV